MSSARGHAHQRCLHSAQAQPEVETRGGQASGHGRANSQGAGSCKYCVQLMCLLGRCRAALPQVPGQGMDPTALCCREAGEPLLGARKHQERALSLLPLFGLWGKEMRLHSPMPETNGQRYPLHTYVLHRFQTKAPGQEQVMGIANGNISTLLCLLMKVILSTALAAPRQEQ